MKIKRLLSFFNKNSWGELLTYLSGQKVLLYAFVYCIFNGITDDSLELLRKGIDIKINQRLFRRYTKLMYTMDDSYVPHKHEIVKRVWTYKCPETTSHPLMWHKCYQSISLQFKDYEIIVLSEDNINDYISLPDSIWKKYKSALMTRNDFIEVISVSILSKYGGVWISPKVYCSPLCDIPAYMKTAEFFIMQNLKPSSDASVLNTDMNYISCQTGCYMLIVLRELLWDYWSSTKNVPDSITRHLLNVISQRYQSKFDSIYKYPYQLAYLFSLSIKSNADREELNMLLRSNPIHILDEAIFLNKPEDVILI